MKVSNFVAWILLFCGLGLYASPAIAQTAATGSLTGTVSDPTGAVIPNVAVTVTNSGTGQARTGMTGQDGVYRFPLLQPGVYQVRFEATGFKTEEVGSITVTVTETAVLDRRLQVGAQNQEVTVQAGIEAVQTASSSLGTLLPSKNITDMPLSSRNYTLLISLSAGVNAPVNDATAVGKGGVSTSVNGASQYQNNYQMDGAAIDNFWGYGAATDQNSGYYAGIPVPSVDAIQEFKIQTSTYDAGYGRNVGANVNVVTKSGTNAFHGTAFEFFRNTVFNANNWFRNFTGGSRLPFNQNQFGGVIGGPIKKDKLFLFASYQGTEQKNGIAVQGFSSVTLPPIPGGNSGNGRGTCPVGWTAAAQCDAAGQAFIANLGNAVCPSNPANAASKSFDTSTLGASALQVACNGSNINPVAVSLLQLKLANGNYYIPGSGSANAYLAQTFSNPAIYREYQGIGNLDYVIDEKNTLSTRFLDSPLVNIFPIGCTLCLPGAPAESDRAYLDASVKLTSLITSNLVNELQLSYLRIHSSANFTGNPLTNSSVGIQDIDPRVNQLAYISTGIFQMGNFWFADQILPDNQYDISDQISWTHNKHNVRAGFEYGYAKSGIITPGDQIGAPSFNSFADFLIGRAAGAVASGGNGTGQSNVASVGGSCQPACPAWRADGGNYGMAYYTQNMSAFVQDDIKLNSHLTVNVGLRWELDGFVSEDNGKWSDVWPSLLKTQPYPGNSPATGSLVGTVAPSNYKGPIPSGVFQNNSRFLTQNGPSKDNFGPRLGFAWQPFSTNRFVLRGGAGFFYDRNGGNILSLAGQGEPPYAVPIATSPLSTLQNPFVKPTTVSSGIADTPGWPIRWVNYDCSNVTPAPASCATLGASSNLLTNVLAQNFPTPLVYQWNLDTQYEFRPTWVLELSYVGSHGIHQPGQSSAGYGSGPPINTALLATPADPVCAGDGNPAHCITTTTVANSPLRVPYLGLATIFAPIASSGQYLYNSAQATVRKQLSHGLSLQGSYTWSRAFVDSFIGNPAAAIVPGAVNWRQAYGLNTLYRPQRFVVNYSWNIPTGNPGGILGQVVNGWNLSGVTTIQDGTPLTITDSQAGSAFNSIGGGGGPTGTAQYCSGMGPANVGTSGGVTQKVISGLTGGPGWLNGKKQGVFCSIPVVGSDGVATGWGNSGLGTLLGPGQNNWDLSLSKLTKVGGLREDATLQFRAEFFNTFNHPQFLNPVLNASSGTFGRISGMSVNPRLLQFALKYAF